MYSNNVIYSRTRNNGTLNTCDIFIRAEAVFTDQPANNVSPKYEHFNTSEALPILADYGYAPVQAMQKRVRDKAKIPFTEHMLAFAKTSDISNHSMLECPEIILYNSHDGSSSFKLFAGVFRFVCSNGIVAGSGFEAKVRHTANRIDDFKLALDHAVESIPVMLDRIERFKGITLDDDQIAAIARKACSLRWDHMGVGESLKQGVFWDDRTIRCITKANRMQDQGNDAWTVFNRIQENLVRGYTFIRSHKPAGDTFISSYRKARAINGVSNLIDVNRELWDVAESIALA